MAQVTVFVVYNGNGTTNHKLSLTDNEDHVGGPNPGEPGNSPNKDNIVTDVHSGDTITWQPGAGVADVVSITPKAGNVEFLENTVHNADGSVSATIKAGFAGGSMEAYNINYKVPGNDTVFTDDPKLKMKPGN